MTFLHTIPRSIVSCKTVHIAHSFTPIIKHTFIPQLRVVFVPSQTIHPTKSGDKAGFTIFFCRKSKLTPFGLQWRGHGYAFLSQIHKPIHLSLRLSDTVGRIFYNSQHILFFIFNKRIHLFIFLTSICDETARCSVKTITVSGRSEQIV